MSIQAAAAQAGGTVATPAAPAGAVVPAGFNWEALAVFAFFFVLVTVLVFWASRWPTGQKPGPAASHHGRPQHAERGPRRTPGPARR